MGYSSVLVVLNDALGQIEKDMDFGRKVAEGILDWYRIKRRDNFVSSGNHCNAAEIISVAHADGIKLIVSGQNTAKVVANGFGDPFGEATQVRMLEQLAKKLGYEVRKRPAVRKKSGTK